ASASRREGRGGRTRRDAPRSAECEIDVKSTLLCLATALLCLWVLSTNVSPDFTPVRSELTAARGVSRGRINLVVLPTTAPCTRAPAWSLILCGAILALGGLEARFGRRWRLPERTSGMASAASLSGVVLLAAVALSGIVSPYRLVLAP